jgi:hypothetical protein
MFEVFLQRHPTDSPADASDTSKDKYVGLYVALVSSGPVTMKYTANVKTQTDQLVTNANVDYKVYNKRVTKSWGWSKAVLLTDLAASTGPITIEICLTMHTTSHREIDDTG